MKKTLLLLAVMTTIIGCTKKPEEFKIEAPRSIQILDRPQAGIKPPFTYTQNGIDEGCVYATDTSYKWEKAPDDLAGRFERNISSSLETLFKGEFSKEVSVNAEVALSTLNSLKYTVNAYGIEVYRVDFTKVDFNISESCLNYLESFKRKDSKLAIEAYKADSVVISYTDSLDNKLAAALKAGFSEKYSLDVSMAKTLTGGLNYVIKGKDLVFGYYPASFKVDLFSYRKPLKLKIPLGEMIDINQDWLKSVSIEDAGDDNTYLIRLNPKVGEQRILRISKLESKPIDIDLHQKLTVSIDRIEKEKAHISISGFTIKAL